MKRQINIKANDFKAMRDYSSRQVHNICVNYYFDEIPVFKIAEKLALKDLNKRYLNRKFDNDKLRLQRQENLC